MKIEFKDPDIFLTDEEFKSLRNTYYLFNNIIDELRNSCNDSLKNYLENILVNMEDFCEVTNINLM